MPLKTPPRRDATIGVPVPLRKPRLTGGAAVEAVMAARRSIRDFGAGPITLAELGQLLWAAQGITSAAGGRTTPSAGATYPLELYAATGAVEGLTPGLYRYEPSRHALHAIAAADKRRELAAAALSQSWLAEAAVVLIIVAVFHRTTAKYGGRGERYVQIEVGHAGQNVCLQAVALGLATTVVGAFEDEAVKAVIGGEQPGEPMCLLPIGQALWLASPVADPG
jgi:SagB-type dehydrogenase family enzyme